MENISLISIRCLERLGNLDNKSIDNPSRHGIVIETVAKTKRGNQMDILFERTGWVVMFKNMKFPIDSYVWESKESAEKFANDAVKSGIKEYCLDYQILKIQITGKVME